MPGLLRLHGRRCIQRLRPGTVAPLHHHLAPRPRPPGWAYQQGAGRPGPGLLRQGRRVPAARRRPLPRHHPHRWPGRADHRTARLGHRRPAHRCHRPGHSQRQPPGSRRIGPVCPDPGMGRELDTGQITTAGELTDTKVAAYVAKYATKAAECTGTLDRRVTPSDQLDALPIRDHARRHIAECIRLSKLPGLEDLRLAAWAHMLGFGGHFATKSRAYSTTLGALRADRATHQREQAAAAGLLPDVGDTSIVVTDWHFVG